MKIGPCLPKLT